jgi:hypothetical protein
MWAPHPDALVDDAVHRHDEARGETVVRAQRRVQLGRAAAVSGHDGFVIEEDAEDEVSFRAAATPGRPAIVVRERSSTNSRGYASRVGGAGAGPGSAYGADERGRRARAFSGAFRNSRAVKDVKIGERRFDRTFKIGGRDENVIRGVFAHEALKAAVRALFKGVTVLDCAASACAFSEGHDEAQRAFARSCRHRRCDSPPTGLLIGSRAWAT